MRSGIDRASYFKNAYLVAVGVFIPLVGIQDISGNEHMTWKPSLPFETTILDYINILFIYGILMHSFLRRRRLETRLFTPMLVIVFGSLIAMFNTRHAGTNLIALAQDLYLFVFFLALYNVIQSERDMRTLVLPWIIVAALEGLLILFYLSMNFFGRASGTVGDSGGAASYLGISLFFILQPYAKIPLFLKLLFGLLVLGAIWATKTLSATFALLISSLMVFTFYWLHVNGVKKLKLGFAGLTVLMIGLAVLPQVMTVRNYLDRLPESAEGRYEIWKAGLKSFADSPLGVGIGPAAFKEAGRGSFNAEGTRKEIHSDYFAFLIERGIIGFIGFLFLLGTIAAMLFRCLRRTSSERELLWVLGLCGIFCFILIDALTHEVMHARYVWIAFAMIAIQDKLSRARQTDSYVPRPA